MPGRSPSRGGETTGDGGVDLSDPVLVLSWLFLEAIPLFCQDAAGAETTAA